MGYKNTSNTMAKSKTDVKRAIQKADRDAGIIRDTRTLQKMQKAKAIISCAICKAPFKVTERMVEQRQHAESKHPKDSYDTCFPEEEEEEAAGYVQEETFAPANNWVCHQTGDVVCNDGFRQAKTHKFCVLSVSVPKGQAEAAVANQFNLVKVEVPT